MSKLTKYASSRMFYKQQQQLESAARVAVAGLREAAFLQTTGLCNLVATECFRRGGAP